MTRKLLVASALLVAARVVVCARGTNPVVRKINTITKPTKTSPFVLLRTK